MTRLEELQNEAAKKFLNSVLLVDDKISYQENLDKELHINDLDEFGNYLHNEEINAAHEQNNSISANAVIRAFASESIHCTPYLYLDSFPYELAKKSDVVVLDWELNNCDAKDIVKNLLDKQDHRIKYVIIYTHTKNVAITQLENVEFREISLQNHTLNNDEFIFTENISNHVSCKIKVISKNEINENNLVTHVIQGFAKFCDGLLRTILLFSLSELRDKSFNLLDTYRNSLDLTSLTHYFSLFFSEDTNNEAEVNYKKYVLNLIADDVSHLILDSENVTRIVTKSTISELLVDENSAYVKNVKYPVRKNVKNLKNALNNKKYKKPKLCIEKFCEKFNPTLSKNKVKENFMICNEDIKHLELSHIDCTVKYYNDSERCLRFGTIVKKENNGPYYLCLLPLCDGERLSPQTEHEVPLLPLEISISDKFDYVVKENCAFIKVSIPSKAYLKIERFYFRSDSHTKNIITLNKKFKSKKVIFKWVDELKITRTQDLLHKLTDKYTRTGMDQFEWLRKKSN